MKKMNEQQRKARLKELRSELSQLYKSRSLYDDNGTKVQGSYRSPTNSEADRINEISAEIAQIQKYDDRVVTHD